jgi:CRP/FNR family cyclic AMP-dependent transcriptional regulator
VSADATRTRSQGRSAKRISSAKSAHSHKPVPENAIKLSRLPVTTPRSKNDDTVFDPEAFLAKAGIGKKIVTLKKDQLAYAQGDPADTIFYVQRGRLRVSVTSANGKEATLSLVGAGEFVGEDCMVSAHPLRLSTASALNECALLGISKAEMVRVLRQEPALAEVFVSFLLARNARVQADLVDQLFNSSEKRLARILLLLAQFGKDSKPETVVPKISQEILAEMIGTTRSRVSFFMNRFRKLGFIEYNGEIRVHNSLLNIFLHESS